MASKIFTYSQGEERMNAITHGIGAVCAVIGLVYMVITCKQGSLISAVVFGLSLIILYTMSTLYHAITNEKAKHILQAFDHSAIFLLIAGSYTPICLVFLDGWLGATIFTVEWVIAIFGIVLNMISVERFKKTSLILYLIAGWMLVFAIKPTFQSMDTAGLIWLVIGGACYTGGIIFYKMKSRHYFHGIWHLCVLAGSLCHFMTVSQYIL